MAEKNRKYSNALANAQAQAERPEGEAIRLAQDGDATAFEYLYNLHSRRIYCLCLRMVRNTTEAQDLTQDAFLQVFRKIHTFRGESGFSTWLHRLTVNVVLMRLRKSKHVEISIDDRLSSDEGEFSSSIELGAEDLPLSGTIDRINLQNAIGELPDGYRLMFVLHDVEGYQHHEIAKILGCSVGNSKSQLHKARLRLRQILREGSRKKGIQNGKSSRLRALASRSSEVLQFAGA